jgi:diguanylate cyclase (GGDEF)-like protein
MAILKKNIWSLFYLIIFLGFILLSAVLYSVYTNTRNDYLIAQENIVKMTANSLNSVLLQYEMTLNILGNQLIYNNNYKSSANSKKILDDLIKLNPSILGFSLVKPNGQEYIIDSNIDVKDLPNLLEKEETKESFKYTLNSSKMIIGRTYFITQINNFIIPLRKAIRDKNNKVIAVMTVAIDLDKGFDFFIKNKKHDLLHETFIFRSFDYYFQIAQKRDASNTKIYNYKIPKKLIESAIDNVSKKYNMSIDEIKNTQIVTTVEEHSAKRNVIASSVYINRYELWITSQFPIKIMHNQIYIESAILIFIFLVVTITMYYLFRYINNYEREKQETLHYQATHDYLTDLHNRFYLSKEFNLLKENNPFSLLFIDMDNFKNINDNYGHSYGDKILIEISKRLNSLKKDNDVLVRYSGDEFIFIIYCIHENEIKKFATSILEKLSAPYLINQYQFILGASIGISQFPYDGKNFDEIKRYADIAMYEAKKQKNSYCIFDTSIKESFFNTSTMEEELKNSLTKNDIYMMYQPQVSPNGKLYGVEALVRWENEKLGFVPPDKFIGVAENMGFMDKLGKFIIKKSLSEIKTLQKESNVNFQLSINISVKQFMEVNFYEDLFSYIDEYNFDKILLTLEVTENVFIEDLNFILDLLLKIKQQGIKISLDDFGTGYSSLSLLKRLPIDELKIDKSFIDDIETDIDAKTMVESIISIGKKLNMYILAEGIETTEQKEQLTEYGCDLFQGYKFSKPLKIDQLKKYLDNQK